MFLSKSLRTALPASVKTFSPSTWALLIAWTLTSVGCGSAVPNYSLIPVSGTVQLDGKPVTDAMVEFVTSSGIRGYGKTDTQGAFTIELPGHGNGLPPETYTARVKGPQVPAIYDEHGVDVFVISKEHSQPIKISLKSRPTSKDVVVTQAAQ